MTCSKCNSGCGSIPCSVCNSNPCGCTPGCGQGGCCQNIVPPAPQPFFNCADVCVEDHARVEVRAAYAASVRVENSFNMPGCDQSVDLKVAGLISITLGSYIWNAAVGFLRVDAFNPQTGIVTATNTCNTGNAAPGTTFPVCTLFVVTVPPTVAGGTNPDGVFVAIDFTAPAVSTCILITLTAVTGISAGDDVQIGGATYRVSAVNSSTTITICNDGAGLTPGSPVIAKNGSGQYQYPVTVISVNPCSLGPVHDGIVIACESGVAKKLTGDAVGQVLALSDPVTGEAHYITLNVQERTCTLIQCCLTLQPGVLTYLITVADSSQFTIGDILQIGTRTDRFTVTGIPDATHIQTTVDTDPGAIVEIAAGTTICIIDCCEQNARDLTCAHQVYVDTLPLFYQVDAIDLDENGYMGINISPDLYTFDSSAYLNCPTENLIVTAHAFVGVWTAAGDSQSNDGDYQSFSIYNEVELAWTVGNNPVGNRAGKMVWNDTYSGHILAYPTDPNSLFNQAPGTVDASGLPINYHGNFIDASALINSGATTVLQAYFRTFAADFPTLPAAYDGTDYGVYIVGHITVQRYGLV